MQMIRKGWEIIENHIIRFVVLVLLVLTLGAGFISTTIEDSWWASWLQNFSAGMAITLVAFLLLTLIMGEFDERREKEENDRREKEAHKAEIKQLIKQLRSNDEKLRNDAFQQAMLNGWWSDGSLREVDMRYVNLNNMNFVESALRNLESDRAIGWLPMMSKTVPADLQECILAHASLRKANLYTAQLNNAVLADVDLSNAILTVANFSEANVRYARFYGADLRGACFFGANLTDANLTDAKYIENALFDENTTLPDGSKYEDGIDLKKFTDPDHDDFFVPEMGKL